MRDQASPRLSVIWRMRWRMLRHDMATDIRRHRDAILIMLGVLPLAPQAVSWPFVTLGNLETAPVLGCVLAYAVLIGVAGGWTYAFRGTLGGGGFHQFVRTLPVPATYLRFMDSLVLTVTGPLVWVAVFLACFDGQYHRLGKTPELLYLGRLLLLVLLYMLAQTAMLRRSRAAACLLLACSVCLGLSHMDFGEPAAQSAWIGASLVAAVFLFGGMRVVRVARGFSV